MTDVTTNNSGPRSWLSRCAKFLATQLLALAIFIGFPALFTAIAPVSWVRFERRGEQVSATAQTCLLFVVPYKRSRIEPVKELGDRFVAGTYTRKPHSRRNTETRSEDEGFLVIRGPAQSVEVPVSPFNLESVVERSKEFLEDGTATELKLFVVANWKLSVFAGGFVSLLAVLYVGTIAFGILMKAVRLGQAMAGVPLERRWLVATERRALRKASDLRDRRS